MQTSNWPRVVITAGHYGSLTHVLECARILTPLDHVTIVVPAHMAARARVEIAWYDGVELVVQMRDQRTTDPLVALTHAFARDRRADIVFLPAEFCIADPHTLAEAIRGALEQTDTMSVIGMPPFDWKSGTQWNPFIAVGRVEAFWDELRRLQPRHAALMQSYLDAIRTPDAGTALVHAYQRMDPFELTRDLLAKIRTVDLSTLPASALRSTRSQLISMFRGRMRAASTGQYALRRRSA